MDCNKLAIKGCRQSLSLKRIYLYLMQLKMSLSNNFLLKIKIVIPRNQQFF